MSATLSVTSPEIVVNFGSLLKRITDREFEEFCQANKDLRIELTSEGELIVMPPTGGITGIRNFELTGNFAQWVKEDGTGKGFDSSTVFSLPNGAKRSPDLSWVRNERWTALTDRQRETFPPLCPDFVVELRSATDRLSTLQEKMREYIANGAQLGWLIDPLERKVHIYRPDADPEILSDPETVSGEPLLTGFVLDVRQLWD